MDHTLRKKRSFRIYRSMESLIWNRLLLICRQWWRCAWLHEQYDDPILQAKIRDKVIPEMETALAPFFEKIIIQDEEPKSIIRKIHFPPELQQIDIADFVDQIAIARGLGREGEPRADWQNYIAHALFWLMVERM